MFSGVTAGTGMTNYVQRLLRSVLVPGCLHPSAELRALTAPTPVQRQRRHKPTSCTQDFPNHVSASPQYRFSQVCEVIHVFNTDPYDSLNSSFKKTFKKKSYKCIYKSQKTSLSSSAIGNTWKENTLSLFTA